MLIFNDLIKFRSQKNLMVMAAMNVFLDNVLAPDSNGFAPMMVKADKATIFEHIITGIVHDMNNPMGLIMLSADVLMDSCSLEEPQKSGGDQRLKHLAFSINQGADKLNRMISLLKLFNNASDNESVMDLNKLVQKSLALTSYNLRSSADQIETESTKQHLYLKGIEQNLLHLVTSVLLKTSSAVDSRNKLLRVITEDADGEIRLRVLSEIPDSDKDCGLQEKNDIYLEDGGWWTARHLAHSLNAEISFRNAEGVRAVTEIAFKPV